MGFTYYKNIPQATDIISESQPELLQNFLSNYNIWNVDHYTFETDPPVNGDGLHQRVTLPVNNPPGSPPSSLASVVYSNTVGMSPTDSKLFFQNSAATFLLSAIKAFAAVSTPSSIINGYGVTSVSNTGTGVYLITLSPALVSGNFAVLTSPYTSASTQASISYTTLSASTFNLNTFVGGTATNLQGFSFVVLQI